MQKQQTLSDISKLYPTDKDFTHNYYTRVYEEYFSIIRGDVKKLCEIGIGGFWPQANWVHGNSLKVWRDYFINAEIMGLDIQKYQINGDLSRITIDWLDQSKKDIVADYSSKLQNYDIILDDGSHNTYDQQITFAYFFKSLKSGGIYVIEDLHTSTEVYMPDKTKIWGWGNPEHTTPLDMLKTFKATGKIFSNVLSDEEMAYLNENIQSVDVFDEIKSSITSIIFKK